MMNTKEMHRFLLLLFFLSSKKRLFWGFFLKEDIPFNFAYLQTSIISIRKIYVWWQDFMVCVYIRTRIHKAFNIKQELVKPTVCVRHIPQ